MDDTARAGAFWLFASPALLEGAVMVFAAMFRQDIREQGRREGLEAGREEGRQEGRAEVNAAWREWNRRRVAAETNGEPFAEPPPELNDG